LRAIAAAEAHFDSAARRGDVAAATAMFLDNAIVVVASDTLRGHDAIRSLLEHLHATTDSARINFTPRSTDLCMDGAVEYGDRVTVELHHAGDTVKTLSFRYAIRWLTYAPGRVGATALVITHPKETWGAKFKDCVRADRVAFGRHRVAVTATLPSPANTWTTYGSMLDVMRARGFANASTLANYSGIKFSSNPTAFWYGVGLRARLWRPFSAEVVVGLQPKAGSSVGFRPSDSTVVQMSYSGGFAWAALNYEWRWLRFGVGPFVARTSWTIREQYWSGSSLLVTAKDKWNDQRLGLLMESAYTFPISRLAFIELQAHVRLLGETTTRGTPSFPAAKVSLNGFGFTAGAGLAL
jgi:ketosteroid isomerase-like protein